jgi:two-component system cell cycle sensor histidine kinase/response regulator CckA
MLYLLEKILSQRGYKVLKATDGEMALEIYRRHKETIDVVLLDIGLPKVAGRDVLFKMKEQNPDVKVVIASGYLEPELKSQIERTGGTHFINKPYLPNQLLSILQSLMEKG